MPDQEYQSKKITQPDGNSIILNNQVEEDSYIDAMIKGGIKPEQLKTESYTPPAKTTMLDRIANGVGYGGAGFLMGGPAMGAFSGGMAAAFPPKNPGEHAANLFGLATGGIVGKSVAKGISMAPKMLAPIIRGGAGVAEAEAGKMVENAVNTGKPTGFNPLSGEGAIAALMPNVTNKISNQIDKTAGVTNQRMRQFFPALQKQLSNDNLGTQGFSPEKDRITDLARNFAGGAKTAVTKQVDVELRPFQDIVKDFESQQVQLKQQLENFKTTPPKGLFQATQQGAEQAKLLTQYEHVSGKLDDYKLDLFNAEAAAIQNKIALAKGKKAEIGTAGIKDKRADVKTAIAGQELKKEEWEGTYLADIQEIKRTSTSKRETVTRLDELKLQYKQDINDFDQTIDGLRLYDTNVAKNLLSARRKAQTPQTNLDLNAKFQAETRLNSAKAEIEQGKLDSKLNVVAAAEKKFYQDAKDVTGVGLKDIENSISHFRSQFKDGALLPPNVRALLDNSGSVDDFVTAAKKMDTQQLDSVMKFLPPSEQAGFKKNLGDSIIFDFFARSYDPNSGMFSKTGEYVKQHGLPNLEFFTGSPDAQRRFSELAQSITAHSQKIPWKEMTGGQMMSGLKNYAVKGVVLTGLYAAFSTSKFHVEGSAMNALAAGTGFAVVSLPFLVGKAMKNPNLAREFIKFMDSGGTLTYSSLPYLSTFIQKESKPMNEQELAEKNQMTDDMIKAGQQSDQPPQQPPQQPQAQASPAQGPQQPQPQPSQGQPTPEQIQIMKSMAAARAGQPNPQGQPAQGMTAPAQPPALPPQQNQQPQ